MDDSNNILWSEGDQIVAFMQTSLSLKYQVSASSAGKASARFEEVAGSSGGLNAGMELEHNIAYYPYSETVECFKSGDNYTLDVTLPSEQTYAPESFGNGAMAMVAVSENSNITFRNILGGMKLQLKGGQKVTSISLQGKNNEKLAGAAVVTAYTDGKTKPAVAMTDAASASVTLNCGSGVQLNESTATEFIIALPPVLFTEGFTVTVTDDAGKTYIVETEKANTVLRSTLLTMPEFVLGGNSAEDQPDEIVPVSYISLDLSSINLCVGRVGQLVATVFPEDAVHKAVVWSSSDSSVASVDQTGLVRAHAVGTADVSAVSGGVVATCAVMVCAESVANVDYIDEYGVNHGKGTAVGIAVWAPVNCGYHKDDYKYGKLYQWGRKYGQGYSGGLWRRSGDTSVYIGEVSDATLPTIEEGGVSIITGNHKSKSNVFYTGEYAFGNDWADPRDDKLWNCGTEYSPIKTDYDPCPDGWRVPTAAELEELIKNHSAWTIDENGRSGIWFSGASSYGSGVPQVFFPASGYRGSSADTFLRGREGCYWSSKPYYEYVSLADSLRFYENVIYVIYYVENRANGYSVRCVQVTD